MNEREFHEVVEEWLRERYDHVEHEPTLPSGREPDFLVETRLCTFLVEVEYHPEDVEDDLIHGAGQATEYAGEWSLHHNQPAFPIVVANAGAADSESGEVRGVRHRMPVILVGASGAEVGRV